MTTRSSKLLRIILPVLLLCAVCAACADAAAEGPATPTDLPAGTVEIRPEVAGALKDSKGVWHLTISGEGSLGFRWNDAGAEEYALTLRGPGSLLKTYTSRKASWNVSGKDLPAGSYTLEITARSGGKAVGSAKLQLKLEKTAEETEEPTEDPDSPSEDPDEPTEDPDSPSEDPDKPAEDPDKPSEDPDNPTEDPEKPDFPGGRPSRPSGGGRFSGRGSMDGEDSGLRITPGKALSSTHAKGSGSVQVYGAVTAVAGEGGMAVLTLGDDELTLRCGGNVFTAGMEEDELVLVTDGRDDWSLTMDVLKTLSLSGIRRVRMISPDAETVLDTDMELTGSAYGRERSQGFVSSDFVLFRSGGEWRVRVEDREYPMEAVERKET